MPSFELAAREQRRALNSTLSIRDIGNVDGGQALVKAVLQVSFGISSRFLPFPSLSTSCLYTTFKRLGLNFISRSGAQSEITPPPLPRFLPSLPGREQLHVCH